MLDNSNEMKAHVIASCNALENNPLEIPLYLSKVAANFPSPADDYVDLKLDLNEYLVSHPVATFIVRAEGESMKDEGIASGDLLIVDRSLTPSHGKIVVAAVNNELTVKKLSIQNNRIKLLPANDAYQPIDITEDHSFVIWGVVTFVIHKTS